MDDKQLICEGPCNGDDVQPGRETPLWARHTAHKALGALIHQETGDRAYLYTCRACGTARVYGVEEVAVLEEMARLEALEY